MLCFGWTLATGCQRQTETDRTQYWIQLHTFSEVVLLGLIFVLKRHLSRQMNGGTLDKSAKTSPSASRRVHQLDGKEARLKFKNKRSKNPNPNGQSIDDLRLISNLKLSTSILGNRLFSAAWAVIETRKSEENLKLNLKRNQVSSSFCSSFEVAAKNWQHHLAPAAFYWQLSEMCNRLN